ncbi:MAG: hypothetical protein CFE32_05640 [Alphaproteobacteria bacterium PA3]|nr:MAG: hypothetical protein CFE32_05640 [Alphaproteobacteria bacterium PA3]
MPMTGPAVLVQGFARGAKLALHAALHAALRRALLAAAAALAGTLAAGFLVFAGFLGLQFLMGPGLAALTMGMALLALAAGLLLVARQKQPPSLGQAATPAAPSPSPSPYQCSATPRPTEAAGLVVFTAAFLLGRRLADRWRLPRTP